MPKKQLADIAIEETSARTSIITIAITSIATLLIIGYFWGPIFLQTLKPTNEPTPLSRDWYVIFELKFAANYWTEGVHNFLFNADCPPGIDATSENGPTNPFSVDRTAEIKQSTVFIRRRGLYFTEIKGDAFGHAIHPSQETAAVYSLAAVSFEDAKRVKEECKISIRIDDGPFVGLAPTRIDKTQ